MVQLMTKPAKLEPIEWLSIHQTSTRISYTFDSNNNKNKINLEIRINATYSRQNLVSLPRKSEIRSSIVFVKLPLQTMREPGI